MRPDETSFSISDAVEIALENARSQGHTVSNRPVLLSDNGPGFVGEVLRDFLKARGIRQIHGAPYHPQTQGKVERLNRKIKEQISLTTLTSPDQLQRELNAFRVKYNDTPHESLKNVSPNEMYAGRQEEILKRRSEIKKRTFEKRRELYLAERR